MANQSIAALPGSVVTRTLAVLSLLSTSITVPSLPAHSDLILSFSMSIAMPGHGEERQGTTGHDTLQRLSIEHTLLLSVGQQGSGVENARHVRSGGQRMCRRGTLTGCSRRADNGLLIGADQHPATLLHQPSVPQRVGRVPHLRGASGGDAGRWPRDSQLDGTIARVL